MNKVRIHTVEQPDSDTTTFVLSCNRLDLLDRTMQSFYATRDYITKMVIVDDSGDPSVFDQLVNKYGNDCDVICFPRNRSQWWAMDFMVSYCDSEYIFYLEEDWEFIKSGYLTASKNILQKYRDIGTVDISWRTFEWEGHDTYDKTLIDGSFYYKKFWRISDYHYRWYGWVGSPNLKRREDLVLLGRVEKYYQEIWIDRKFFALGFKSIYLNDHFVNHLGDGRSRAADHRANEHLTPEDKYPKELLPNRVYPVLDYHQWDRDIRNPYDTTVVTAILNINRDNRDFESHYINSLTKLLETRHPVIIYAEEKYHDMIKSVRGNTPTTIKTITLESVEKTAYFDRIQQIISNPKWYTQSSWMQDSVLRNGYYIPLTLEKLFMLEKAQETYSTKYYYWVDAGMFSSYYIQNNINDYYFTKIPGNNFFMTSFPYIADKEIHGYNIDQMTNRCDQFPTQVTRATIFGGTTEQIDVISKLYKDEIENAITNDCIGTEESMFTILSYRHPELFNIHQMHNGDIKNFLETIRR